MDALDRRLHSKWNTGIFISGEQSMEVGLADSMCSKSVWLDSVLVGGKINLALPLGESGFGSKCSTDFRNVQGQRSASHPLGINLEQNAIRCTAVKQ